MLEQYVNYIKNNPFSLNQQALGDELFIEQTGELSVYYAPFEYINKDAKIIICGITPGIQQAILALEEASKQLTQGSSIEATKKAAKNTASFGGPMRKNLIRLLDYIGLPPKLGITSCSELFDTKSHLVHYTSALRYPVFKSSKNYSGTPSMVSNLFLRKQLEQYLLPELGQFSSTTLIIPLGPKVEEALRYAARAGVINEDQILAGLPHPSGANAERISYFLGQKPADKLSVKTDPAVIDAAKQKLIAQIKSI
jgi:hypothetical protein